MSDDPAKPAAETPMQRALRLKNAARDARPKTPGSGFNREADARMRSGASKPWLKK